jgi:hypothetical protein
LKHQLKFQVHNPVKHQSSQFLKQMASLFLSPEIAEKQLELPMIIDLAEKAQCSNRAEHVLVPFADEAHRVLDCPNLRSPTQVLFMHLQRLCFSAAVSCDVAVVAVRICGCKTY